MKDIIIIGAGPAGNIVAEKTAQAGLDVLVLDWRQIIGDKLCTGIIGKECLDKFPPREEDIYHKVKSATLISPNNKTYRITRNNTQAAILNRVSYIQSFANKAKKYGAKYNLEHRVTEIKQNPDHISIKAKYKEVLKTYKCKLLIISSGFNTPLLRMVGIETHNNKSLMGSQIEVEVEKPLETQVYFGKEISPGSFGWLVPLSKSRALLGVISKEKTQENIKYFLNKLINEGKILDLNYDIKSWGIPISPINKTYKNRILITGDAAGLTKPTTGGGIYYSLLSGQLAAKTSIEAINNNNLSENKLKEYQSAWKNIFGKEISISHYSRLFFETLNDEQIEKIISLGFEFQKELINESDFSFDWHSKVILKAFKIKKMRESLMKLVPIIPSILLKK